jgi:hypothetical protein
VTTSVSGEAAAGARSPSNSLSLSARLTGVVRRPGSTFSAIVANPTWAGVLATTTVVTAFVGAMAASTDVGRTAIVDQWERSWYAFGHEVSAAEYDRLLEFSAYAPVYSAAIAVLAGPVLAGAVAILSRLLLSGRRVRPTMAQALAVSAHAGVILAVRQVFNAPAGYIRETAANGLPLSVWVPGADAGSVLGRFLGVVDVFVLWWVVVLAIGLSVLYRRRATSMALGLIGVYIAGTGLLALAMGAAAAR